MRTLLLGLIGLLSSLISIGQTTFEAGYFIDNFDQKINCLIKNLDSEYNPTEFKYKLSQEGDVKVALMEDVKEFGIPGAIKYLKTSVQIDISSSNPKELSTTSAPEFEERIVFLRAIVEGEASLYLYQNADLRRFFFKWNSDKVEPLVYKRYLGKNDLITKNTKYRRQLWSFLFQCTDFTIGQVEQIGYSKRALEKTFLDYNSCIGSDFTGYTGVEDDSKKFKLALRPGISARSMLIRPTGNTALVAETVDFGSEFTFRIGLEAQLYLPFRNNKWSVIIEPTYGTYTSSTQADVTLSSNKGQVEIDYTFIEIPLGIRHHFYLNENSAFFVNGQLVVSFHDKTSFVDYENASFLDINDGPNLVFGAGLWKGPFTVEARYAMKREIIETYHSWRSNYSGVSLVFGYQFL